MIYPSVNDLMSKVDSRYTLVVEVAKRARQIVAGSKPMVSVPTDKPVTIAIYEVLNDKVHYRRTKEGIK